MRQWSTFLVIALAVAACGSSSDSTATTDDPLATSTTHTVGTTTTTESISTTSTTSTTTTVAPTTTSSSTTTSPTSPTSTTSPNTTTTTTSTTPTTTTPDPPPGVVAGVMAGLGGGSGEVSVTWDHNTESDLGHYVAYFSELPGGLYSFLRQVPAGDSGHSPGRAGFIDFDRDLTVGKTCYRVAAVDAAGNEGAWSVETCFNA